jgi:hypothetical protein
MLCYRHLHSSIDGIPFYWCLKLTQPSKRKILCQLDIWNFQDLACPARFERATYALEEFVAVQKLINSVTYMLKLGLCNKLCNV